eukprot:6492558-Amphidinium_carterae.5
MWAAAGFEFPSWEFHCCLLALRRFRASDLCNYMDNGYIPQPLLSATVQFLQVQSQTLQTFLVTFVLPVQWDHEASVHVDLDAIEANNAPSFAVLVEEALSPVVANEMPLLSVTVQLLQVQRQTLESLPVTLCYQCSGSKKLVFTLTWMRCLQREQEARVHADLDAITTNKASSFAVLVDDALSPGLQLLQSDVAVIANAMKMLLFDVARAEAKALSLLFESNYTFTARLLETNLNVCRSRRQTTDSVNHCAWQAQSCKEEVLQSVTMEWKMGWPWKRTIMDEQSDFLLPSFLSLSLSLPLVPGSLGHQWIKQLLKHKHKHHGSFALRSCMHTVVDTSERGESVHA